MPSQEDVPERLLVSMVSTSRALLSKYASTTQSFQQVSFLQFLKPYKQHMLFKELYLREESIKYNPAYQITANIPGLTKVYLDDCSNNNDESKKPKVTRDSQSNIWLEGNTVGSL